MEVIICILIDIHIDILYRRILTVEGADTKHYKRCSNRTSAECSIGYIACRQTAVAIVKA